MYKIMLQHSSNLINSLQKKVDADEVIEVKEWVASSTHKPQAFTVFLLWKNQLKEWFWFCRIFGPYSMDVVASTAFSVDIDSINHPSDPFVANIKKMINFSVLNPLLVLTGNYTSFYYTFRTLCHQTLNRLSSFSSFSLLAATVWEDELLLFPFGRLAVLLQLSEDHQVRAEQQGRQCKVSALLVIFFP